MMTVKIRCPKCGHVIVVESNYGYYSLTNVMKQIVNGEGITCPKCGHVIRGRPKVRSLDISY